MAVHIKVVRCVRVLLETEETVNERALKQLEDETRKQ